MADLPQYIPKDSGDIKLGRVVVTNLEQADDVVLLSTTPEGLQKKLDGMYRWCSVNFMLFNAAKSAILVVARSRPRRVFDFGVGVGEVRVAIEVVTTVTYLGCEVAIDQVRAALEQLTGVQEGYLRSVLDVGKLCMLVILFTELGLIPLEYWRLELALVFMQYAVQCPRGHYVREALCETVRMDFEGLSGWFSDTRRAVECLPFECVFPGHGEIEDADVIGRLISAIRKGARTRWKWGAQQVGPSDDAPLPKDSQFETSGRVGKVLLSGHRYAIEALRRVEGVVERENRRLALDITKGCSQREVNWILDGQGVCEHLKRLVAVRNSVTMVAQFAYEVEELMKTTASRESREYSAWVLDMDSYGTNTLPLVARFTGGWTLGDWYGTGTDGTVAPRHARLRVSWKFAGFFRQADEGIPCTSLHRPVAPSRGTGFSAPAWIQRLDVEVLKREGEERIAFERFSGYECAKVGTSRVTTEECHSPPSPLYCSAFVHSLKWPASSGTSQDAPGSLSFPWPKNRMSGFGAQYLPG
ncbi:hypothetical protein FA13DRAFT_1718732 [Coprinellus micaceus]|uniref:Reverse transcriptase domain-containing protein n=1 Tax=Coprinellus micaceus TaxID=71717 RepID=A0A4Y7SCV8_COPMI|nr:hypothetical protein FA13DRAFT_1718732 [Coprinellus micaceus]